jgi:UDP-glucose 4-epimerase
MKKNVLITGVAGLLGSRLADWIIENKGDEYQVIGVDDLSGGFRENVNPEVKFWQMDLVNHPIENIFDLINFIIFLLVFVYYSGDKYTLFTEC